MQKFLATLFIAIFYFSQSALALDDGYFIRSGIGNFPASPVANQTVCLDSTTGILYVWNGTAWAQIGPVPSPSASTLGGVESYTAPSHQWINQISTSGVPSSTQPAFSDVNGSISLSQFPVIATAAVLGNVSGTSGTPTALSTTQLTTLINPFTSTLSGSVPASGGGTTNFLRADGTFAAPPGGVTSVSNSDGTLTVTPTTGSVVASLVALAPGQILVGNASSVGTPKNLSGDAALSTAGALTLNTVNSNVGSFTAANITVNAKGQITAASNGSATTTGFNQLHVYLVSGSPEADGSSSGNANVFVGPYKGNLVTWDNGSGSLTTSTFTETSASVSGFVAGNAGSIYEYNNAGTWTEEIDQDWTNPTTPPTYGTDALGRRTKNGATNKLLVGCVYCSSNGLVFNWTGERSLSNELTSIPEIVFAQDTTSSWTYGSSTVRAANANVTNGQGRITVFNCRSRPVFLNCFCNTSNSSSTFANMIGIGINSTTTPTTSNSAGAPGAGAQAAISCSYSGSPAVGLNYFQRLEAVQSGSTGTFYYTNAVFAASGENALVGLINN